MLLAGNDEPQGTDGGQEQPKGIGAHKGGELAALVLRHAIISMAVTDSNFHGPAIRISLQNGVGRQRHIGAEKGFQGLETPKGLWALGRWALGTARPPDYHDPYAPSGQDAVPYPHPGSDEGPRFLRVRVPGGRRRRQGLGRTDDGAFFARRAALALEARRRRLREFGRA